jgi:hypothetical protein
VFDHGRLLVGIRVATADWTSARKTPRQARRLRITEEVGTMASGVQRSFASDRRVVIAVLASWAAIIVVVVVVVYDYPTTTTTGQSSGKFRRAQAIELPVGSFFLFVLDET